ncbi:L-lactate dehydrogenase [Pseudaestuariivita rosea]|uniref:L-lactate dehydrogenase n=1 Tax=Pseudaestuariivita rosea TaxID=2763263 RepID=UPI001ABA056B|nr:L-lactate dehydrogenase [Pseudaestuariivita rosea]
MKVGVVGAGMVGSASAYAMALMGVGSQIVLVDQNDKLSLAHAQDISHATPFAAPVQVTSGGYEDLKGARVVVIAAGVNQQPGESRVALLDRNADVFRQVIGQIEEYAPDALLVVATNPVDVMTYVAWKLSDNTKQQVIGTGTVLDTARFRTLLGGYLGITPQSVHAYVLGEHGDSEVPIWSSAMAGSVPVTQLAEQMKKPLGAKQIEDISTQVRDAAYSIIDGKGSTYYGIGAGVARIVRAILDDERSVLSVSIMSDDILGVKDVPVSLPRVIGADGVITDLMPDLSETETEALIKSATLIRDLADRLSL